MTDSYSNDCGSGGCGCHTDVFPTDKKCSVCGGRLRLAGRSQEMEFRLECAGCGFVSPRLSTEELHEVL
ncbi:hypothetical protein ACFLYV_01670 [Chloroflexota bacterium]